MSSTICVAFDLYGTLLDTSSVTKEISKHIPESFSLSASAVSTEWRKYQLEYTWRLVAMGNYEPFDLITRKSLIHAAKDTGLPLTEGSINDVINSYKYLTVFEDVPGTLSRLETDDKIKTVIFTNGTEKMVETAIDNSPELKHFSQSPLPYVVVGDVKSYKPSPAVYQHLAKKLGKEDKIDDIWLVSGNPFDIVGAQAAGMRTIWVDRAGKGWADQLGQPTCIVNSLEEVAGHISG
ncbi:haloacid dehalogenase, type II [Hysterangium stoloniferum]|nr:haloacid dehalogenase, type II [Hysterangium stoloniferum]